MGHGRDCNLPRKIGGRISYLEAETRAGRRMGAAQGNVAAMTTLTAAGSACALCWRSRGGWPASAQVRDGALETVTPLSGKLNIENVTLGRHPAARGTNPMTKTPDTYVTVVEAARRLGVSRARIYQLVESGKLRARKKIPAVSRISLADVEARLQGPSGAQG
jgi:excisionase family DNA binding protein